MKRIGIIGMGGIGGFIGAPLAATYRNSRKAEIIFICRGETLKNIRNHGLKLRSSGTDITVEPALASDDVQQIGKLDILFITTKSYSLVRVIKEYQAVLKDETILIPVQNMVNAKEIIQKTLPHKGKVLEGCIYVASNIREPAYIEHIGGPGKIFIGGEKPEEYNWLTELLTRGGLNLTFHEHISEILWTKYLFVSPVAAVTTAYDVPFGELPKKQELKSLLIQLMEEVKYLAEASGIHLAESIIDTSVEMLHKFPYKAKPSLQLDVEQKRPNEKVFLIDFVYQKSKETGLSAEGYHRMIKLLNMKAGAF